MPRPLEQHQIEMAGNKLSWDSKPLIRRIYAAFYAKIIEQLNLSAAGKVVEIGAGIGNLKSYYSDCLSTDIFPNPWLDLVCDAYRLPFQTGTLSNLILFDVFHHLARPLAFLADANRALTPGGRLILFEPYISPASWLAYGLFHHEPVAWDCVIDFESTPPAAQAYYAAQGNATRLFFRDRGWLPPGWRVIQAKRLVTFAYLLSRGLSKSSLYPDSLYPLFSALDGALSAFSPLVGGRCLVVLARE